MRFTVTMKVDSLAFATAPAMEGEISGIEVADILTGLAAEIEDRTLDASFAIPLQDTNGNLVGLARIVRE